MEIKSADSLCSSTTTGINSLDIMDNFIALGNNDKSVMIYDIENDKLVSEISG